MTAVGSVDAVEGSPVKARRRARLLGRSPSDTPAGPLTYAILVVTILVSAFPVYWMLVVASSTEDELAKIPPSVVPKGNLAENFRAVFNAENVHFVKSLLNSLVVASIVTVSVLFFCSLAGFAFAKLRFRGRNVLMVVLIATLAVPNQLGVVALYIFMNKLGWNGQLQAVIVPSLVTAFGVFYMRQFILDAVPDELIEAARVDGASTLRIYASIVFPALRPAVGVLGLFTFAATWNDFQWPLITLSGGDHPTVQVALSNLASGQFILYTHVLAGAFLATLPLLVIFFIAGRQIVAGIMEGAVKS
jgi:cellobiose transport system permease protein